MPLIPNPRALKRCYLPLESGAAIIAGEDIGGEHVHLTICPAPPDTEELSIRLTLEEWRAVMNMYYDLCLFPPAKEKP